MTKDPSETGPGPGQPWGIGRVLGPLEISQYIVTTIVPAMSGRTLVLHASNTLFLELYSLCLTSRLCIVSTETAAYSDQSTVYLVGED